uniref:Phosphoinositide phospholipase C n=1 Tax=Neogobius melanostomus TaxID=47308 RepID=A0A8C6UIW8_9GOBI
GSQHQSKSKPASTRRADIQGLFYAYSSGSESLSVSALLRFLQEEQHESTATEEQVETLIDLYEIEETARENRSMLFTGFLRYMESKLCSIFNQAHCAVYQDMDQPLTSYFISSSHNTYLTGDQLVGQSHLDAYVIALRKGCRCLEIDCWDGPEQEPTVYHGYTLTTKILFRDVISTIGQHAFEVSVYPVILSLENHCSKKQQEVMAQYLVSILGDKLLTAPLDHPTTGELPSPNQKKKVVAEALSDLVIYTRSVKFVSFSHSRDNQNCYENTSMSEKKASKLVKTAGGDFVRHNQRFLSRIYPAGSRTTSSNYNPQKFWNVGAQLVALNFQSLDLAMDLNDGRFLDNGGCGYVLKPDVLMSKKCFDPGLGHHHNVEPTSLLLRVISGSHLPVTGGKPLDPYVQVKIHGAACDVRKEKTHTVKNNSLSPYWGVDMHFSVAIPELCLIRFCVRDRTGLFSSEFVGQYSLPLLSMKKGEPMGQTKVKAGLSYIK